MKIVCLGDSHTYALGVPRSEIWTKVAEDRLGVTVINKGISGDTSGGMLARFYHDVVDEKPQMVFIMGGSNDLIMETDLGVVRSNIMAMVHQAVYNNIMPVIGIPIKIDADNVREDWRSFTDFRRMSREIEEYRDWLIKFCTTFNVNYIDYYALFPQKMMEYGFTNMFLDGLHPTGQGNRVMGEIFAEYFKNNC